MSTPRSAVTTMMVYITASSREEAVTLSRALLDERLIACANILENGLSLYNWQGKIMENPETYILAKTEASLFDTLAARVKALHNYDTPCIVGWNIDQGHAPFLEWVRTETSGGHRG